MIRHDVRSRNVGTKYAIWVKYPLPIFNIITMPNIAQFLLKLNKKIKAAQREAVSYNINLTGAQINISPSAGIIDYD